jgi:hypothetical protein
MATRKEKWEDENKDWLGKIWDLLPDQKEYDETYAGITEDINKLFKKEDTDVTKKDYYDILGKINKFHQDTPDTGKGFSIDGLNVPWGNMMQGKRMEVLDKMDILFPDRRKDDLFKGKTPHREKGRPFVESDVTEAILEGALKKPEAPYEGPFGKLGEHFSKNAAARDKLFQYLGSMGREFVKPIEPGKEAAGALLPTLSRGFEKGEEEYASKQAAATKRMLDMAEAQQKINPLQYFSTKMKEAKAMVPEGIEPGSADEKKWIANYLRSTGIPTQLVDLTASVESLNLQLMTAPNEERKKELQAMIDGINKQILDLASQGMGGTTGSNTIAYLGG